MTVLKELDPEGVSQRARRRLKRRIYRNKVIVSLINPIMIVYEKCLDGFFLLRVLITSGTVTDTTSSPRMVLQYMAVLMGEKSYYNHGVR